MQLCFVTINERNGHTNVFFLLGLCILKKRLACESSNSAFELIALTLQKGSLWILEYSRLHIPTKSGNNNQEIQKV